MDRQWRKLILLISLLLIPSLLYAMPLWMVGGNSSTTSSDACSACPSDSDGGDVACEDFEGTGYLCSWAETTTNCTTMDEDSAHSGTLSCTDKGSDAIEVKYNVTGTDGNCYSQFDAGAAKTTAYVQFYMNTIETGMSASATSYFFSAKDTTPAVLFNVRVLYASATTYYLYVDYYTTGSAFATISGTTTLNEGTWYKININTITDSNSLVVKINDNTEFNISDLTNARDPRYFQIGSIYRTQLNHDFQIDDFQIDDDTEPGACQ